MVDFFDFILGEFCDFLPVECAMLKRDSSVAATDEGECGARSYLGGTVDTTQIVPVSRKSIGVQEEIL
jgi:hypothetical protein